MDAFLERAKAFVDNEAQQQALTGGNIFFLGKFGKYTANAPDYTRAILARDPRCFVQGRWLALGGHCYLCSRYNAAHAWKDLHLELVCGSLGFGTTEPRWFEHGSLAYSACGDFTGGKPLGWDWHVWLEDSKGRVYDIVSEQWRSIAALHGKEMTADVGVIDGAEKDDLLRRGLHYVPASKETQHILLATAHRVYSRYASACGL